MLGNSSATCCESLKLSVPESYHFSKGSTMAPAVPKLGSSPTPATARQKLHSLSRTQALLPIPGCRGGAATTCSVPLSPLDLTQVSPETPARGVNFSTDGVEVTGLTRHR